MNYEKRSDSALALRRSVRFVGNHLEHAQNVCVVINTLNSMIERNKMSWLRCDECDDIFNAKEELDWKDDNGHITCMGCLERYDDVEPDHEDDGEALASAGFGTDEDYRYYEN